MVGFQTYIIFKKTHTIQDRPSSHIKMLFAIFHTLLISHTNYVYASITYKYLLPFASICLPWPPIALHLALHMQTLDIAQPPLWLTNASSWGFIFSQKDGGLYFDPTAVLMRQLLYYQYTIGIRLQWGTLFLNHLWARNRLIPNYLHLTCLQ